MQYVVSFELNTGGTVKNIFCVLEREELHQRKVEGEIGKNQDEKEFCQQLDLQLVTTPGIRKETTVLDLIYASEHREILRISNNEQ